MISTPRSTAIRSFRSCRYCPNSADEINSWTARAASSMSQRYAESRSSGGMNHLFRPKNRVAAERIPYSVRFDQIDIPSKKCRQLLLHIHQIEKAPTGVRVKRDQDVHIAI